MARGHSAGGETENGRTFPKQPPAQRVLTLQLTNDHFVIPPGADNFRVEARGTLPNGATLLSFFPHMHLRGKTFEYNIVKRVNSGLSPGQESKSAPPKIELETLLRVN